MNVLGGVVVRSTSNVNFWFFSVFFICFSICQKLLHIEYQTN